MKSVIFSFLLVGSVASTADVPKQATLVADFNSDGTLDYTLEDVELRAGRNTICSVFLSDADGTHRKLELDVINPSWDPKEKTLTSCSLGGGGRTYVRETYRFSKLHADLVKIVERSERHVNDEPEYTMTIKTLVNGRWTTKVIRE
jgi:hypothetical protein